jgi:predicted Zn finger-like uncharacterized protein
VSLATRCSACGTVFRVQKDQLKASEGWVRCGRCGTVFSALEGLFDLEREAHSGPMPLQGSPLVAPPAAASAPTLAPAAVAVPAPAPSPPPSPAPSPAPPPAPHPPALVVPANEGRRARPSGSMPLDETPLRDADADRAADRAASLAPFRALQPSRDEEDDDAQEAASIVEHSGSTTIGDSRPHSDSSFFGPASRPSLPPTSNLPSFAREADGVVHWKRQRPVVRRLTIAAAVALPLLLAAQVVFVHRDLIAARWPASADALRAVCVPLGCTVEAPRVLDAMTVESSGLSRIDGTALYRLQLAVRNRAAWPVAMPAFDLTLTDTRGEIVSRRVLRAADFAGPAPAEIAANAEWSAQATLDVGERRVTGYTVDLFYP